MSLAAKPLLMPVLMAGRDRPAQRALALGGAGDVAVLGRGETAFTAWLGASWPATWPGSSPCASVPAARTCAPGQPGGAAPRRVRRGEPYLSTTGKDRIPVLVYSAALLAMSLAALDSGSPRTAAGGALFLASDSLLALEKFGGLHLPAHEGLVMATYTTAQALLAG